MKSWSANLLVADDLWWSITGKVNLIGVYTGDIGIPLDGQLAAQLVFFFLLEGELGDQPTKPFTLEIALPGDQPRTLPVAVPTFGNTSATERTKWFVRTPFLVQQLRLRPGRIVARIIYEGKELRVGAPWINQVEATTTPTAAAS